MARKAVVSGGVVENVIIADDDFKLPGKTIVTAIGGVSIGWTYNGETFAAPEPAPDPVPLIISRRQCITQAMIDEWITVEDAEAWAGSNTLPAAVIAVINSLPEGLRPPARIKVLTMVEVRRDDPLMWAVATLAVTDDNPSATSEDISAALDEFFRDAILLT